MISRNGLVISTTNWFSQAWTRFRKFFDFADPHGITRVWKSSCGQKQCLLEGREVFNQHLVFWSMLCTATCLLQPIPPKYFDIVWLVDNTRMVLALVRRTEHEHAFRYRAEERLVFLCVVKQCGVEAVLTTTVPKVTCGYRSDCWRQFKPFFRVNCVLDSTRKASR